MAVKYLKKCSTSLVIREIQIKTTLRFHLTPVRMTKIKNSGDSRCWRGCGERGTLLHCWWGCKLVQPLWKSIWQSLRKLGMSLLKDPAIPLLGIYPEDSPACNKDICSTMFIAALFIIARICKERGTLLTAGAVANWYNHSGNQSGGSSENWAPHFWKILLYHSWAYTQIIPQHIIRIYAPLCS